MKHEKLPYDQLFDLLDKTWAELLVIISSYSEEEINTVPAEDSWTAAQVVDHVTKSNKGVASGLEMTGKTAERNLTEREPELKDVFLNFTIKLKSPEFILPAKSFYEKEFLVADLKRSIGRLENLRNKVNLSKMIILPGLGEITKLEILYFVLYHTQRHIHQLENILKTLKSKNNESSKSLFKL